MRLAADPGDWAAAAPALASLRFLDAHIGVLGDWCAQTAASSRIHPYRGTRHDPYQNLTTPIRIGGGITLATVHIS